MAGTKKPGVKRKYSDEDTIAIREFVEDGVTYREIHSIFGISYDVIQKMVHGWKPYDNFKPITRNAIDSKKTIPTVSKPQKLTTGEHLEIVARYEQGWAKGRLAETYGVTRGMIDRILRDSERGNT